MRRLIVGTILLLAASALGSPLFAYCGVPYANDFESEVGEACISFGGLGTPGLWSPPELPDRSMLGPFYGNSVSFGVGPISPIPTVYETSFDLYLFGSWEGQANDDPEAPPDTISVGTGSGYLLFASFSLIDGKPQSFPQDEPASNPAFTGATETGGSWARYHLELTSVEAGGMSILIQDSNWLQPDGTFWAIDNFALQMYQPTFWYLTVQKLGTGSGVVTSAPEGIDCGGSCQYAFPDETEIELLATPGNSSVLGGWSGCTATGDTCSLTITGDSTISVTFDSDSPAVLAAFEFSPAQPVAGEATQFTDTSTGEPTSFTWDFGDGSQPSSEQHPSHTFAAPGDYEVTLEASNTGSLDATSQIVTVAPAQALLGADFTFSPPNPTIGETVSFIDTSVGSPTAWQWDFGDGSPLSNVQNPEHSFGEGVFSVTLEVSRDSDQDADIEITTITVGAEPAPVFANFTFTPEVPAVGEEVQFLDLSTGNLTSWLWSFADGGESTDPNPTHTFFEPGLYDVLLTVSDEQSIDATISTVQVVDAELHPDFEISPEMPVAGQVVRFLDRSTGGVTSWSWDFGDGSGSTESEALHAYEEPGAYTVQLEVSGGAASGASTAVASVSKRIVIAEATNGVTLLSDFYSGREGRDDVRVLVRRGGDPAQAASVRVEVSDESALRGSDYAAPASVLVQWSAGDSSVQEVVIDLIDDAEVEATETLSVELTQPEGVTLGEPAVAAVAVLDDDFVAEPEEEQVGDAEAEEPRVITDANGNTAVVWREIDGGGFDVLAQVFGPDGAPLGGPFPVSTSGNPDRSNPVAAWDAAGNLFVTWVEGSGQGVRTESSTIFAETAAAATILGRFFSPGGQPQGAPLPLSGAPTGGASAPNIAADPSGEVVVTWEEPGGPRARVVKRNRQPDPLVLAIESASIEGAAKPEVDKLSTGDFVAVWKSSLGSGGIRARIFAENGSPRGAPFFVVPNAAADNPAVAVTADGGFVVVWDAPTAAQGLDVFGQLFEFDGSPASSPFVVNGSTAGDQRQARVDANSAGDFAVAFESSETPGARGATGALTAQGQSIVARFFDPAAVPLGGDVPVSESEAGIEPAHPDVAIDDSDTTTVVYERRGPGNSPEGVATRKVQAQIAAAVCDESSTAALCLQGSRFRATVRWQGQAGNQGSGLAIPLTSDTGYFWFFDQDNVELVLKVLDGCALNGRFWVFAAGLTDVEIELVVDDVLSGESRAYFNPLGRGFEPVLDTSAFATCNTAPSARSDRGDAGGSDPARVAEMVTAEARGLVALAGSFPEPVAATASACTPSENALCLGSRFEVRASWRDSAGNAAEATAVPLTTDTGTFWFFDDANVELVVKVLQACVLNDRFWVFAGGLTDVEVVLTLTDTTTGVVREYRNPLGQPYATVRDTSAFACP